MCRHILNENKDFSRKKNEITFNLVTYRSDKLCVTIKKKMNNKCVQEQVDSWLF